MLSLLLLVMSSSAFAKRSPPAVVPPVKVNGMEVWVDYQQTLCSESPQAHFVGALVAREKGEAKWRRVLYQRTLNCALETDVQEIHPKSLRVRGGQLVVVDECGLKYRVDAKGRLISPLKSVIYREADKPGCPKP